MKVITRITTISVVVFLFASFPALTSASMVGNSPDGGITEALSSRTFTWAGSTWQVKRSDVPVGPGGNYFSDSINDVWVDASGKLHLTITKRGGVWKCTEVIRQNSQGYGVYVIQTSSRIDRLDANAVGGIFTWDSLIMDGVNREIDWEIAKWGDPHNNTNSQYVVQPCPECPGTPGQCIRFRIRLNNLDRRYVTTYIVWDKAKIEFRSYYGQHTEIFPDPALMFRKWRYTKIDQIPTPGNETMRFNLWLFDARPPISRTRQEIVFSDYTHSKKWITIDKVSEQGDTAGTVAGRVACEINPSSYRVEVFIKVDGRWWPKPFYSSPHTTIAPNRTWLTDITTGGHDQDATNVIALLIAASTPAHGDPESAKSDALAWDEVIRQ